MSTTFEQGTENAHDNSRIRKSRHRVPTSCGVCRKKKIKCDKIRPFCGACIRNSTLNACHYENQPWGVAVDIKKLNQQIIQLKQQNAELKALVVNYEIQINQLINEKVGNNDAQGPFNASESFHLRNDHVMPHFSNQKKQPVDDDDIVHGLVRDFDVLVIKENKLLHYGSTSFMALATNDPLISDVFGKFLACQKEIFNKMHGINGTLVDTNDSDTAILSSHSSDSMSQIVDPINSILPPKSIFTGLLNRFFEKCYLFMPYVDRNVFSQQLGYVLKYTQTGDCYFIVPTRSHLITVAMALIFLRFAYLTLPLDKVDSSSKNKDIDDLTMEIYARNVHISALYAEHAKNCITNSSALRKANLQIVQALLYLKFYKLQSPEDGDAGIDSVLSLSIIIQMAKMVGLNRDPGNFDIVNDVRVKHVWRKIWYKLMEIDAQNALAFGCELLIPDDNSFDTELPYISSELQRSGPLSPHEATIIKQISLQYQTVAVFRRVAKIMLVMKKNPKRSDIDSCVAELELFMKQKLRPLQDFVHIGSLSGSSSKFAFNDRCERATECIIRLSVMVVHYILNYVLMLTTLPENKELRRKYYQKSITSALSIFKFCFEYFKHPSYIFGDDMKKLVTPSVVGAAQRAYQMICVLVVRYQESFNEPFTMKNALSPDLFNWLTCNKGEIAEISGVDIKDIGQLMSFQLYSYMEDMYKYASKLSGEYFLIWKFCKLITMFIVYLIEKRPIYKEFSNRLHARRKGILYDASEDSATQSNRSAIALQNNNSSTDNNNNNKTDASQNNPNDASNLMRAYDNFVKEQLQQLDMYLENQDTAYWANLIDEAGQNKFDYFNPLFDSGLQEAQQQNQDALYLSDSEGDENANQDTPSTDASQGQYTNSGQPSDPVSSTFDTVDPFDYNGKYGSFSNNSNTSSKITPNTLSDIQTADFLNSDIVNQEIDKQFRNFGNLPDIMNFSDQLADSSNTTSSAGNYPGRGDSNLTPTRSNSENGPSPSEVNYGIQIAKMMFGNNH